MAPSAGKVTPRDAELVAALEKRFPALPERGALFQQLNDAKFDVSGELSFRLFKTCAYCNCSLFIFLFFIFK